MGTFSWPRASATVLLSVFSLIYSKRWERRQATEEAQRDAKRQLYEQFIHFWFGVFGRAGTDEEQPTDADIQRFSTDFNPKLILWGGDDVLVQYNAFRTTSLALAESTEVQPAIMYAFESFLYSLRRDLGHSNKGLGPGDLLRVFINDIDAVAASVPQVDSE